MNMNVSNLSDKHVQPDQEQIRQQVKRKKLKKRIQEFEWPME